MGKVRIIEQGYSIDELKREIDKDTKQRIYSTYELEDEIKLLRRTLVTLASSLNIKLPQEFVVYNDTIEQIIAINKARKAQIRSNTIKIRVKEENK